MFISRFIQLAIQAYLLCLLMVVCWPVDFGAVAVALPAGSQQRIATTYKLFHRCSNSYVYIRGKGFRTGTKKGDWDVLVTRSSPPSSASDFNSTIQIQGNKSKSYLCFSRNGRLTARYKFIKSRCTFREELDENHYTLLRQGDLKVGFSKSGKYPLPGNSTNSNPQCFQFMKQNVTNILVKQQHNGSVQESVQQQDKKRHEGNKNRQQQHKGSVQESGQQPHKHRHGHQKKNPHPHRQGKGQKQVKPTR